METSLQGKDLINAAQQLILDVLSRFPDGLTSSAIGEKTGLSLPIKGQNEYVTWALLTNLAERGQVVKEGRKYKLA